MKKTERVNENYWALLIEPNWVSSSIWSIEDGKVKIISQSPTSRWERSGDLLQAVDASLSACSQNLADDISDPTKTVFGVPSSWVEGGKIKEENLIILKKICQELSLAPSGFVVLSEAISHYIKQQEESSLSGIVIGFNDQDIDLSIFSLGKLIGTTNVMRSISIEEDIFEGLNRLMDTIDSFPPRIILFNQKEQELDEIKNKLESADWNKLSNSKFIHTPKLEIFDPNNKILAISLAGGSEVSDVKGLILPEFETNTDKMSEDEVNNVIDVNNQNANDLGFEVTPADESIYPIKKKFVLPNWFKFPKINKVNVFFSLNKKLLLIAKISVLLFIGGFICWWFLPKATVVLYITPKKLEETMVLAEEDLNTKKLEIDVSGEKTKTTTGTKIVGEKAKGKVKIQNGTDKVISLASGTIITSSTNLKFNLVKSASVSAALSTTEPGEVIVDIEAGGIGSEFNLSKDEKFKVSNYPRADAEAISVENFVGGSSREIQAVSEEDRKKIFKELNGELLENAKQKLSIKTGEDQIIIDSSLSGEVTEEKYSNKTGDEANNIKLNLSLKVGGLVVSKSELNLLAKNSLEERVPDGFLLNDANNTFSFLSTSDNKIELRIVANLFPEIDTKHVARSISGRYPKLAENYLSNIVGFVRAEFRIKPLLPGRLGTLPHLSKNITIKTAFE